MSAAVSGIWGGVMQTVCGSMAVHGGRARGHGKDARCPLIASLVMSILAGVSTCGVFIFYCIFVPSVNTRSYFTDDVLTGGVYNGWHQMSPYGSVYSSYVLSSMMITYLAVYLAQCLVCWGQVVAISVLLCNNAKGGTRGGQATFPHPSSTAQYIYGGPAPMPQNFYPPPHPAVAGQPYLTLSPPAYAPPEKV